MTFLKKITDLLKSYQGLLCLVVFVVVFGCVAVYSKQLGLTRASMKNIDDIETPGMKHGDQYAGESGPPGPMVVNPAMPIGFNSGPGQVSGLQTPITSGVPQSCMNQQVANPSDLLPNDDNSGWGAASPRGAGELANVNLLKAGQLTGIDTVAGTLRNANLQLRSEPPNPKSQVSPWSNSTIEPDLMRVPLELGCGPQ